MAANARATATRTAAIRAMPAYSGIVGVGVAPVDVGPVLLLDVGDVDGLPDRVKTGW